MYAPFRAAVDSTFKGDRKRYQQPVGASKIAGRALRRDLDEGADFVLVKPALFYGDIISEFAKTADVPVVRFHRRCIPSPFFSPLFPSLLFSSLLFSFSFVLSFVRSFVSLMLLYSSLLSGALGTCPPCRSLAWRS